MYVGLLFTLSLSMLALPGCDKKDKDSKPTTNSSNTLETGEENKAGKTPDKPDKPGTPDPGKPSTPQPPQTDPALGIQWVKVEGGTFTMGSPDDEKGRYENEGPQHEVEISGFWMSATEVTNAQYNAFLEANKKNRVVWEWEKAKESGTNAPDLDAKFKGDNQPAVMVSWENAKAFCKWVRNGVTLPTEAQWEYACRAGSKGPFGMGKDGVQITAENLDDYAWYKANADGVTHAVGEKKPNDLGLYDMHGNAWEWCSDWYGTYPADPAKDPTGPLNGNDRIRRGGGWDSEVKNSRSAQRAGNSLNQKFNMLGFRLVAPLVP